MHGADAWRLVWKRGATVDLALLRPWRLCADLYSVTDS